MCLKTNSFQPIVFPSGYAIKAVLRQAGTTDTYTSYWAYFEPNGGGVGYTHRRHRGVRASRVRYKLGRTYRVKHKRTTITMGGYTTDQKQYPALVHCYKNIFSAVVDSSNSSLIVFIVVKYSGGQYEDDMSVTAKYVTPICEISITDMDKVRKVEMKKGFQTAIKEYLKGRELC